MNDSVVAVLLNYNQTDYTLKCLKSLLESDYKDLKIILVDNGSKIENAKELESQLPEDKRLIYKRLEDNIGYGQGTNFGLEYGLKLDPKYFLILNNDTIIDANAVTALVEASKLYKDKARVTGKVYYYDEPNKIQMVGYEYRSKRFLTYERMGGEETDHGQYDEIDERVMIDDVFVLQTAELTRKLKGYSPYFWINGVNVDISLRALKEGCKIIYTPDAKIWHKGSASIGGRGMNPKLAYWHTQSSLILRSLHLNRIDFVRFYGKTLFSVFRTYMKSFYLKWFKKEDILDYARAKWAGMQYFNKWVFNKHRNEGYNPF